MDFDDANEFERNQVANDEAMERDAEAEDEARRSHMDVIVGTLGKAGYGVRIEGDLFGTEVNGDFVAVYLFHRQVTAAEVAIVLEDDGMDENMVKCEQRGRWVAVVVL